MCYSSVLRFWAIIDLKFLGVLEGWDEKLSEGGSLLTFENMSHLVTYYAENFRVNIYSLTSELLGSLKIADFKDCSFMAGDL